jgi:hypothetical protein
MNETKRESGTTRCSLFDDMTRTIFRMKYVSDGAELEVLGVVLSSE